MGWARSVGRGPGLARAEPADCPGYHGYNVGYFPENPVYHETDFSRHRTTPIFQGSKGLEARISNFFKKVCKCNVYQKSKGPGWRWSSSYFDSLLHGNYFHARSHVCTQKLERVIASETCTERAALFCLMYKESQMQQRAQVLLDSHFIAIIKI